MLGPVRSPKESVYYYECSYGNFRLTFFIPFDELKRLCDLGKIRRQVLEDFPDGVDLRVGETDYADFKKSYGYRPEVDPEVAKNAFYSILSTTKDWKDFLGSGIVPAKDIENRIGELENKVGTENIPLFRGIVETPTEKTKRETMFRKIAPEKVTPEKADLLTYRRQRQIRINQKMKIERILQEIKPKGIDSKKTLQTQKFSELQWTTGDRIEDVFKRIQQKRPGGEHQ